ncbi:sirohydrochlorin cobaltochelatase [uncultured Ruthenibacterium sp.]|uniref:sirohydrochlorin cobaltochelatase n=1 Tax=uncultured Ruthenibacterium sp. TaxID=1905347 RepID=UPI00349EC9F4
MEQLNKRALLAVSFGSSVERARKEIDEVERAWISQTPERDFYRVYTSPTIRRILAQQGQKILNLPEALEYLANNGYMDVVVPITHFLYGFEYEKLREETLSFQNRFCRLRLGRPLIADSESLQKMVRCILHTYPVQDGLVLLGHGTEHFANMVYPALQTAFRLAGAQHVYVGTIEGWPSCQDVLDQLREDGCHQVLLAPLMLVAGDHALNDMAGEQPDSWKCRLEAAGLKVQCCINGLGAIPEVRKMYQERLREILRPEEQNVL